MWGAGVTSAPLRGDVDHCPVRRSVETRRPNGLFLVMNVHLLLFDGVNGDLCFHPSIGVILWVLYCHLLQVSLV